jgi:tetratricopeptide (TPR) repeat protein
MIGFLLLAAALATTLTQEARTIDVPSVNPIMAEGDAHYGKRQESRAAAVGNQREILLAIAAYDKASAAPDSAEARWKLARALYFQGAYTGLTEDAQKAVFEKARKFGDDAIRMVEGRVKRRGGAPFEGRPAADIAADVRSDQDAAPAFFWAAVGWGQWALVSGKIQAVKTGAAEKVRDYAEIVVAIDPEFENGGGYRILGRLHHQAPSIPFLTGWISREKAVENLRKAVAIGPRDFINRHFLAEVLADGNSAEKAEAIRIEEEIVADSPSPGHLVEDVHIMIEARKNLAKWKK